MGFLGFDSIVKFIKVSHFKPKTEINHNINYNYSLILVYKIYGVLIKVYFYFDFYKYFGKTYVNWIMIKY